MAEEPTPVDVGQAARALGISVPAVRKRIRRGSLRAYKVDGVWRVVLPAGGVAGGEPERDVGSLSGEPAGQDALIEQLRSENAFLRGLVAELTRRVPELPVPSSTTRESDPAPGPSPSAMERQNPSAAKDEATPAANVPTARPQRRSWWRRLLER